MGIIKGGALRLFQTFLYAVNFACSAIILGIYSYFLAVLSDRDLKILNDWKAVEGLSGAAVLYTIFAVVLTSCLGGVSFFAFLAIVLDLCFCGCMVAIAVMTREGAHSCHGFVRTPLGNGPASSHGGGFDHKAVYAVSLETACKLNKAAFAVSIVAAVFFPISALMQVALVRHHKKEKRYGPGPSNNYTSGYGPRNFWRRGGKKQHTRDAELATAGGLAAGHKHDTRPSHDTNYTGSTMAPPNVATVYDKGEQPVAADNYTHAPYKNQTHGTAVNPYGYDNTKSQYPTGTATNY